MYAYLEYSGGDPWCSCYHGYPAELGLVSLVELRETETRWSAL